MNKHPSFSYFLKRDFSGYLSLQALDFLQKNSRQLQFMRTKPLPVSGAFHTELMQAAVEPLRDVLRQMEVSQTQMWRN